MGGIRLNYLHLLSSLGIGGAHPGGLMLTKQIFESEQYPLDYKILDAGCGTGQTAAYLTQLGYNVTGIDINMQMIEHATIRNHINQLNIPYYVEDLAHTSFSDASFDLVLCESVLQFTSLTKTLSEIARILKSNGSVVAIEMVQDGTLTSEEQFEIKSFYGCEQIYTISEWKQCFLKHHIPLSKVLTKTDNLFIDENEPTTEFSPIEDIPQDVFELLSEHERLTQKYSNKLSFCILFGQKC